MVHIHNCIFPQGYGVDNDLILPLYGEFCGFCFKLTDIANVHSSEAETKMSFFLFPFCFLSLSSLRQYSWQIVL
jgi:hypothetical protein